MQQTAFLTLSKKDLQAQFSKKPSRSFHIFAKFYQAKTSLANAGC